MKHLIISIISIILSSPMYAQKIMVDKTENGIRSIMTTTKICRDFTDKAVFSFGLAAYITDSDTSYKLIIDITRDEQTTPQTGEQVSLRTASNEVMKLDISNISSREDATVIGNTLYTSYITTIYADLTATQLDKLCTDGIIKIRIPSSLGNIDKEYKKDKASPILSKCLTLINDTSSTTDDF